MRYIKSHMGEYVQLAKTPDCKSGTLETSQVQFLPHPPVATLTKVIIFCMILLSQYPKHDIKLLIWHISQVVKTSLFHGEDMGSTPVCVTSEIQCIELYSQQLRLKWMRDCIAIVSGNKFRKVYNKDYFRTCFQSCVVVKEIVNCLSITKPASKWKAYNCISY